MRTRVGTAVLSALACLVVGPVASAEPIGLADAQAYHKGITKDELKRFRELYESALRKTGATIVPAYGKGSKVAMHDVEFVTTLSLGREGDDYVLTGQVSRVRLDAWAARSETKARASDGAAIASAMDQVAGSVLQALRSAPPRSRAEPPRKPREYRTKRTPATHPVKKDVKELPDEAGDSSDTPDGSSDFSEPG